MGAAPRLKALLIEDAAGDARLIREQLAELPGRPVQMIHADRLAAGIERLTEDDVDVVLLDLSLPDSVGLDTFRRLKAAAPRTPVVVLSGMDDEVFAVQAVHEGAQDYLVKGQVNGHLLARAMRYAVERQRMELERAELQRQKDEFFANVSHDLRTPIAAIKASIGVVLAHEPPGTAEPLHRLLVNIDLAADEIARLVDDVLELNRLRAGRVRLRLKECDLRDLAHRSARAVEGLVHERGQRLELALADDAVPARVDADRIVRLFVNLLSNAHKYGREGGTIRFTVASSQLQDAAGHRHALGRGARLTVESSQLQVLCSVQDDGPGVPYSEQERIFDRFYRSDAHPDAGTREGSGLGLAIARAVAERHGGSLWLQSTPGSGATFWLSLPIYHHGLNAEGTE